MEDTIWICPSCGLPNGGSGRCGSCGRGRPDPGPRTAMLAQVLNLNYGTVNNVYVSPVEVVDIREVQAALNEAMPETALPALPPGPGLKALPPAPHPLVRALNAFSTAGLILVGIAFLAAFTYVLLL